MQNLLFDPPISLAALAFLSIAWCGCAADSSEDGQGASGAGGSSISFSSGSGATEGIGSGVGGGEGGSDICVSTSEKAEPVLLDLLVLLDRSHGMDPEWDGTTSALKAFFEDPESAGISAGLVYYPTIKDFAPSCEVTTYALLDVPIASLPDNAFPLTNSMPQDATGGHTPTYGALRGALMAATARQEAYPTHKVNVVMATDGGYADYVDDFGCPPTSLGELAALAEGALDYNGVKTYAIGIATSAIGNLHAIAKAGGTVAAFDVTQDIDLFSDAMAAIREVELSCEFVIPPAPLDMEIVPDLVNVTYTPGGTNEPLTVPRADDLADCGDQPGWYYDSNAAPRKVLLCPASCAIAKGDRGAEVAVAFGCASVLN